MVRSVVWTWISPNLRSLVMSRSWFGLRLWRLRRHHQSRMSSKRRSMIERGSSVLGSSQMSLLSISASTASSSKRSRKCRKFKGSFFRSWGWSMSLDNLRWNPSVIWSLHWTITRSLSSWRLGDGSSMTSDSNQQTMKRSSTSWMASRSSTNLTWKRSHFEENHGTRSVLVKRDASERSSFLDHLLREICSFRSWTRSSGYRHRQESIRDPKDPGSGRSRLRGSILMSCIIISTSRRSSGRDWKVDLTTTSSGVVRGRSTGWLIIRRESSCRNSSRGRRSERGCWRTKERLRRGR